MSNIYYCIIEEIFFVIVIKELFYKTLKIVDVMILCLIYLQFSQFLDVFSDRKKKKIKMQNITLTYSTTIQGKSLILTAKIRNTF